MRAFLVLLIALIAGLSEQAVAQSFQIEATQVEIAVAAGFDHAAVRVPIAGTTAGFNFATLSVTSDVSWIVPSIDTAKGEVALTFKTAGLLNATNTGTITLSGSGTTDSFFVKAGVAPLNVVKFVDDPVRSRTYGIHQNGLNAGSLIVIDPLDNSKVACVTVGKKPANLAVSRDGSELLVINCVDKSVTAIDLATLRVKEVIGLPTYDNWGVDETTADVAYGPGSSIYYTDGAWAPALRVYDRTSRQVIQTVLDNSNGIGGFALAPDGTSLFAWIQYGWSAGWAGSYIVKYSVDAQGKLTAVQRTNSTYPTGLDRDPLDTPVLIDTESKRAFVKQLAVSTATVTETQRSFPKSVYSISPGGEIAATDSAVFQVSTGINLLNLPVTTPVQTITSDYSRLVYFNKTTRTIGTIDLLAAVGPAVLNRNLSPADGSITLAPSKLEWSPIPGVDRYQVYLGLSETEVQNASTTSSSYLGEVTTSTIVLNRTWTPGTHYYWRVDAVTQSGVVKGVVYDFIVSLIGTDRTSIQTATVQGHAAHKVAMQLTSATPQGWQASADQPWVKFESNTGTTPSTLTVILDASQLSTGVHSASISIALASGGQNAFTVPVTFEVEPLAIKVMESDRTSGNVYAISEDTTQVGGSRAYLLEIDTVAKEIKRVARVGTSATDLAVHNGDGRIYVANWMPGSLLAIDKTTFAQVRAYGFSPFGGTGYGENDVYRIAAGNKGRLVVEEEDQWIDISIFDTESGTKLNDAFVREGGGEFGAGGRFYYHGENNSSGAEIRKFDVTGDVFTEMAHVRVSSADYYGSRTVVVSENGKRVFWNGAVLNENLVVEWLIGKHIYATTPDGKYAFGADAIYDVDRKQAVLSMPVATQVSAYNATSGRLVVQVGAGVKFFELKDPVMLPTPVLSVKEVNGTSVQLTWTDESLETGFTLQVRKAGTIEWADVPVTLGQNSTSCTVSNLLPSTAYEFRIKADSSVYSSDWSATAAATTSVSVLKLPSAETSPATSITATGATLNGIASANGLAATAYFEYGLTSAYGVTSSTSSVGQNSSNVSVVRILSSLAPNSTYHYRLVVTNSDGTTRGQDQTFTTLVGLPTVSTNSPITVGTTSATLSGSVNPNGSATMAHFEYGTTPNYGSSTDEFSVGTGSTSTVWTRSISGLLPNTLYYCRIVATNAGGTAYGQSKSFVTSAQASAPKAVTNAPANVGANSALLKGTVNANGSATSVRFEYGTDTAYGNSTDTLNVAAGTTDIAVSLSVSGLSAATTYHYRLVATNKQGASYGLDQVFTTGAGVLKAVDDEGFTTGREAVRIDVLANDTGSSRATLRLLEVTQGSAGSVVPNFDGSVTYTPNSAFEGVDVFTYKLGDGTGVTSVASVTIRDSFQACAGTYNGLVGSSESVFDRSGCITVTASRKGTFTGVLQFGGAKYPLKGKLRYDGQASVDIKKAGGSPLLVSLRIDPSTKQLTGGVSAQVGITPFEAGRVAFDASLNPASQAGRYTLLLSPVDSPSSPWGYGFATMTVTESGRVTLAGRTGAGAAISTTAYVGPDARFPLYAVAGGKHRTSVQGWVQFRNVPEVSDCDGTIGFAVSPKGTDLPIYPPAQLPLIGSRYITPAPGNLALQWAERGGNGAFKYGIGSASLTSASLVVTLSANHTVKVSSGRGFTLRLDPKTGYFSGSVTYSRDKGSPIFGVLFQRQAIGAGVVKTKQGTGWVLLEEAQIQNPTLQ